MTLDYKALLLAGMIALPFMVVCWGNSFDSSTRTAIRVALAVGAVWGYILLSRYVVVEMDLLLADSQEARQAIYDGDGAKNAFALLFGWVPGVPLAALAWAMARAWLWLRARAFVANRADGQATTGKSPGKPLDRP